MFQVLPLELLVDTKMSYLANRFPSVMFVRIIFPFDEIEVVVVFELRIKYAFWDEPFVSMGVDFDPRRRVLWLVMMTRFVFLE